MEFHKWQKDMVLNIFVQGLTFSRLSLDKSKSKYNFGCWQNRMILKTFLVKCRRTFRFNQIQKNHNSNSVVNIRLNTTKLKSPLNIFKEITNLI